MMTILIAPDKFKGSLDSFALCEAMAMGVRDAAPEATIISLPLADGGDGFANVMAHYLHTQPVQAATEDAAGNSIIAQYQWNPSSKTAIIELAAASGLAMLEKECRNPLTTSTLGTGLLVKNALDAGAEIIILGIGGSGTNDGGTGLLSALGYLFLDTANRELKPCGGNLEKIKTIVAPHQPIQAKFMVACDVNNPLTGPNGATHVYAAQKGAMVAEIAELEKGMVHFAEVMEKYLRQPIAMVPGAGAAGGTAAGLLLLPHVRLKKGTDIVLSYSRFHEHLSNADLVFTGEGGFDLQTLQGKVVYAVAQACKEKNVPCIAVCGKVEADEATIKASGLIKVVAISEEGKDSFGMAGELVREKVKGLVKAKCY